MTSGQIFEPAQGTVAGRPQAIGYNHITIGAAHRAAAMVVDACSGVVFVVVGAVDDTSHAEARLAKPSQASQSRDGQMALDIFVMSPGLGNPLTTGCGGSAAIGAEGGNPPSSGGGTASAGGG